MSRQSRTLSKAMLGCACALALSGALAQDATLRTPPLDVDLKAKAKRTPNFQRLPDLRPTKVWVEVLNGPSVRVHVNVQNQGSGDSAATSVVSTARVIDTTNNTRVSTQSLQQTLPAVAAGTTKTVFIGTVSVPNRTKDWLITFVPTVVDPSPLGQRGGSVPESNEDNNEMRYRCIVYGPTTDPADLVHLNAPPCD